MINAESGMHLILKCSELDKQGKMVSLKVKLLKVIAWTDIGDNKYEFFPVVIERASYSSRSMKWLNNNSTASAYVLRHKSDKSAETLFFSIDTGATLNDIYHLANACLKAASWSVPLLKTNNNPI